MREANVAPTLSPPTPRVEVRGLCKRFRDGDRLVEVLRALDLRAAAGEFVALLGRSGSGKSTLLNCIAGIETIDAGMVVVDGVDLARLSDRERTLLRRDRIGIVFQFFNLLPTLTVRDNVALPALLRGEPTSQALARADALLAQLSLAGRGGELPDHLSGGEQQRVATARALINDPAVLLADEPTGNLDSATGERTLALLRAIGRDRSLTVILATHSREAAAAADRVVTLSDGRVVDGDGRGVDGDARAAHGDPRSAHPDAAS
jgi:putative ABC transport system ATP-binding protein